MIFCAIASSCTFVDGIDVQEAGGTRIEAKSSQLTDKGAGGTQIESRSSQLTYEAKDTVWPFAFGIFANVKQDAFNRLNLVSYTPHGLYIGVWDGMHYCANGRSTTSRGGVIQLCSRSDLNWEASLEILLRDRVPGQLQVFLPWPSFSRRFWSPIFVLGLSRDAEWAAGI